MLHSLFLKWKIPKSVSFRRTQPVIIHRLLTNKTVDNNIARALSDKKFDQDKLLDEVRRDFNNSP